MIIREIRIKDAAAFLDLCRQLDQETSFMMLEPGERTTTVQEQERRLQTVVASETQMILVVEENGALVGYLAATAGGFRRNSHSAYIVTGVRQQWTGRGLGRQLFEALERWALEKGIHRLELTVMTHNSRAFALYEKVGFAIEGVKRHSLRVGETYVDEYYMAKLLTGE